MHLLLIDPRFGKQARLHGIGLSKRVISDKCDLICPRVLPIEDSSVLATATLILCHFALELLNK
jgi:hypothetical protein